MANLKSAAYIQLPERFYQKLSATQLPNAQLLFWNASLAKQLQLNELSEEQKLGVFSGQTIPPGITPVAQAYAGHQFGSFTAQLGDGRARLLGDVENLSGELQEVHLKGSGVTPFSRRGDGLATLSSVLRELMVSEGMHSLGIPTSRTLAVIKTGEIVQRESELPGGVLVRVAASHVRIGTFEYFAARRDVEALRTLANFVIVRHYPHLVNPTDKSATEKYVLLFEQIMQKQIKLICQWMRVGFIHGVMNTDNTFVSGETLDYGPCAFMEAYDPLMVLSSIDHGGRYAYARQPQILHWNLQSLAYCLALIINNPANSNAQEIQLPESLVNRLENFDSQFTLQWQKVMGEKIGLRISSQEDLTLLNGYFDLLQKHKMDFTLGFRQLNNQLAKPGTNESTVLQNNSLFFEHVDVQGWLTQWKQRITQQDKTNHELTKSMDAANPLFIPRNHLVEKAIGKVVESGDLSLVEELLGVWRNPYEFHSGKQAWSLPATENEKVTATFCGT